MIFGTRNQCSNITFDKLICDGNTISRADKVKYLGIQLDPLLNFDEHVDYIKKKTIGKVKLLGRLNSFLSSETLLMLYKTLILPVIDYSDIIYDCMSQKNAMVLQKVQNMAFKSILKVLKRTSTAIIHSELNMLTLAQRRQLHMAKEMFKIDKGLYPATVITRFQKRSEVTTKCTRAVTRGGYNLPRYRLQQSQRNFVYRGMKLWEDLPPNTRAIADLDSFICNVKLWLVDGDVGIT